MQPYQVPQNSLTAKFGLFLDLQTLELTIGFPTPWFRRPAEHDRLHPRPDVHRSLSNRVRPNPRPVPHHSLLIVYSYGNGGGGGGVFGPPAIKNDPDDCCLVIDNNRL